ncbi:hypothetical protein OPT61_g7794 [Boeremia exigua]|uniref:Uncharacterized protein n=1 Tax=Boeremia exigua TaxID=749465 RepID=A0ACC2I0U8_9PLEO|nr:hypothetical protein OPT61_g7794 [Boeremia exigua]
MERQQPPYTYTRLDKSECNIRLLHLLPSNTACPEPGHDAHVDSTGEIQCTFSLASLDDPPPYEALSYVWGGSINTASITLHDHYFPVTHNLKTALDHLRLEEKERILWIDALCINQSDEEERSFQVSVMHFIYSRAAKAVIFLGPAWDGSDATMDLLKLVADRTDLHFYSSSEQSIHAHGFDIKSELVRESLSKFFDVPWWTRVWTVQEFVLAPRAEFLVGCGTLDSDVLRRFMEQWQSHMDCCMMYTGLNSTSPLICGLQKLFRLIQVTDALQIGKIGFLEIVSMFRPRKCWKPVDKLYGMLGMAHDSLRTSLISVDYSRSPKEVFKDYVVKTIRLSESLDCLSFVYGARDQTLGLQSFVPNFTASINEFENDSYNQRIGGNYFLFNAARDSKPVLLNVEQLELTTAAITFDSVFNINHTAIELKEVPIKAWGMFNAHQTLASPYASRLGAFWRTFCGGVSAQAMSFTGIWCKPAEPADIGAFEKWLAAVGNDYAASNDSEVNRFHRAYDSVTLGRRFAITSKGYIGWVPAESKNGDVVMILPGGRVPYVLRRASEPISTHGGAGNNSGTERYKFLGDAYIQGIMNGEAYDGTKQKTITLTLVIHYEHDIAQFASETNMHYTSQLKARNIRLLRIELDTYQAPIRCHLSEASLDNLPEYEALSYAWGDLSKTEKIECDGQIHHVTINAARAMRRIRLGIPPPETSEEMTYDTECEGPQVNTSLSSKKQIYRPRFMWIDAICIDQGSNLEKNHQVQLMREIYSKAKRVIVWLGDSKASSKRMSKLTTMAKFVAQRCTVEDLITLRFKTSPLPSVQSAMGYQTFKDMWRDLSAAFLSDWYNRVWCVQEIALARDSILLYRNAYTRSEDAAKLYSCVFYQTEMGDGPSVWLQIDRESEDFERLLASTQRLRAAVLHKERNNLGSLLHSSRLLVAGDPRDKFYGLLGLFERVVVDVDYNKSVYEVYKDSVIQIATFDFGVLAFVYHGEEYIRHESSASWIPDWQSLEQPPLLTRAALRASSWDLPTLDIALARAGCLQLKGILCDTVTVATKPLRWKGQPVESTMRQLQNVIFDFLNTGLQDPRLLTLLPWAKTFTGGGFNEPELRRLSSREHDEQLLLGFASLMHSADSEGQELGKTVTMCKLQILKATRTRKAFLTSKTWLGLGPGCMKPGDVVVVFHGVVSPYVLRPVENRGGYYYLMGECYVENLADEEAYRMLEEGRRFNPERNLSGRPDQGLYENHPWINFKPIKLMQADGFDQLKQSPGREDDGDPFPGFTDNRWKNTYPPSTHCLDVVNDDSKHRRHVLPAHDVPRSAPHARRQADADPASYEPHREGAVLDYRSVGVLTMGLCISRRLGVWIASGRADGGDEQITESGFRWIPSVQFLPRLQFGGTLDVSQAGARGDNCLRAPSQR